MRIVAISDLHGHLPPDVPVARVQPRLHVFGHIHEARGREGSSYNVAIVDERYQPYELPLTVIDL